MHSIIKYFGGKGGIYKKILSFFPDNNTFDTYIEPFGGAASILFQKQPSPIEIYNDLEMNVYSLFKVLSDKNLFKQFKEKCDLLYYSSQLRKDFKKDLKRDDLSLIDRALRFFLVNRTSVRGIGGFYGPTGVVRRNMAKPVSDFLSSIDNLYSTHQRLSRVIIENRDAIEIIEKYDKDRTFFIWIHLITSQPGQRLATELIWIMMNIKNSSKYCFLLNMQRCY